MRALGWFWAATLLAAITGGVVLQLLGPPPKAAAPDRTAAAAPPPATAKPKLAAAPTAGLTSAASPTIASSAIVPPDPELLEPSSVFQGGVLPKIGPGGRASLHTYAAPFDVVDAGGRPRVALLLAGIGQSQTDSEEAIRLTPGPVSLAVSPYAIHPDKLLAEARAGGHELLLSLPMEPDRFPIDDPGPQALLTGNQPSLNGQRLEWALTRFAGYVGVTGALNGLRGERFAASADLMDSLMLELARRGLLYVDPRVGAAPLPFATGRDVDVLIDEPAPVRAEIEANLARLEQVARERGAALGLVSMPRPVTLDRIAVWAAGLEQRGLVLAPVSAIAIAPPIGKAK